MKRLPPLIYNDMTTEQQKLHDDILAGPRSRVAGPMLAWFLNPHYGELIQKVGAFCRYETSLPPRLSELAILVVARHWKADVEWIVHSEIAFEKGVSESIVDAIKLNQRPTFTALDEELVHDIAKSILEEKHVSDDLFSRAIEMWNRTTVLELSAIIGYYSNIALQLNLFEITEDDGRSVNWES